MQTDCRATLFELEAAERRALVAGFGGGNITLNVGALLLGQVGRGLSLIQRVAHCFTDRHDPRYIESRIETLVGQRIVGLVLGYEDLDDQPRSWQSGIACPRSQFRIASRVIGTEATRFASCIWKTIVRR